MKNANYLFNCNQIEYLVHDNLSTIEKEGAIVWVISMIPFIMFSNINFFLYFKICSYINRLSEGTKYSIFLKNLSLLLILSTEIWITELDDSNLPW